jgi:putative PIN family toxin of toxin-antitoxin system
MSAARVVLDTNVLVSAMLLGGNSFHLLQAARYGRIQLFSSLSLCHELEGVLSRPKFQTLLSANSLSAPQLSQLYRGMVQTVDAPVLAEPVSRDPQDDMVLACAVAAKAELIVTGDEDLLTLSHFQNIWIANPRAAVAWLQIPV